MATSWKYLANTKKERKKGRNTERKRKRGRDKIERQGGRKEGGLALRIEIE